MNQSIDGIVLASGLTKEDQTLAEALLNINKQHMARNQKLVNYYEGDVTPPPIGVDTIPECVSVEVHCDWPRKAVTSVSERSRFDGFSFENDETDDTLDAIVRDNALTGSYNRHVHSELIHGCMFATVGRYQDRCQVRFHTAESSAAIWDEAAGRISAGLVVADYQLTKWSPNQTVPVQVNMHTPGRVIVFRRISIADWVAETVNTPIDRPAMEAFCYRPTGLKPFGESRISKTVMSITDEALRTLQNMAVSSAFYSSPQKYLLGLTDEQYDTFVESKFAVYVGNVLLATRDEDGNVPEIGQLTAQSPEPYRTLLQTYASAFSGATGVPLNSLGIVQDNPSSAQAIEAAREDICIAAQDLNQSNGESLRNVALMAMAVANDSSIDDLSDKQKTVVAKFSDPSMPSVVSQADAAVKIASVAPWIAQSDVFLEMLGFDEAQRRRLANARTMANTQSLLQAFARPTQPAEPEEEESTEEINAADSAS